LTLKQQNKEPAGKHTKRIQIVTKTHIEYLRQFIELFINSPKNGY